MVNFGTEIVGPPAVPSGQATPVEEVTFIAEKTYEFDFPIPSTSWNVAHNLNRKPSVTIEDSAGEIIMTTYDYVDLNTILITFGAPTSGKVYLN